MPVCDIATKVIKGHQTQNHFKGLINVLL